MKGGTGLDQEKKGDPGKTETENIGMRGIPDTEVKAEVIQMIEEDPENIQEAQEAITQIMIIEEEIVTDPEIGKMKEKEAAINLLNIGGKGQDLLETTIGITEEEEVRKTKT